MKFLFLLLAALLSGALSISATAETAKKKSKSGGTEATPKPRLKPAAESDNPPSATPKPRKKSSGAATPKATPRGSKSAATTDTESDKPDATPKQKRTPAATPTPKDEPEEKPVATPATGRAPAATLAPEDLREFATQPPRVQELITASLELTKLNLTYTFGSAEPAKGGMDCSGTMYHVLRAQGFTDVPRESSSQYAWARKRGQFFAVIGKSAASFEFDDLQPGDLLFWTGTYKVDRDIPITHVMLYLGTEKKTKNRVMFGASDGRSYAGIQRWGVSVFDFKLPRTDDSGTAGAPRADFVGYARIPALRESANTAASMPAMTAGETPVATSGDEPKATPKPATPRPKARPKTAVGKTKKRSD